jgi:hypothetical protein
MLKEELQGVAALSAAELHEFLTGELGYKFRLIKRRYALGEREAKGGLDRRSQATDFYPCYYKEDYNRQGELRETVTFTNCFGYSRESLPELPWTASEAHEVFAKVLKPIGGGITLGEDSFQEALVEALAHTVAL